MPVPESVPLLRDVYRTDLVGGCRYIHDRLSRVPEVYWWHLAEPCFRCRARLKPMDVWSVTHLIRCSGLRRISAKAFSLGFRVDWAPDLGVLLLVMIELGLWRTSLVITKPVGSSNAEDAEIVRDES